MSFSWDKAKQKVGNELGAVLGSNATQADANYSAPMTTGTVIGPDFTPSMIEDALAGALGRIVEAIASTPLNPERAGFTTQTVALASGDLIPRTDSGGTNKIVGVIGAVRDSSDDEVLELTDLDKVRSFARHSATVYEGFDAYWYALDAQRIIHTRTEVEADVCTYTRPAAFTGDVPLDDWHESGLVKLAVAEIALKESMFANLYDAASKDGEAHLAIIRNYGNPDLHGNAQAASSPT
jgi:hypothetical protein